MTWNDSRNLLTPEKASPKLAHAVDEYLAAVFYGAPSGVSGYQACPQASPACVSGCIFYTGRAESVGSIRNTIHAARIGRTRLLFSDPVRFMGKLSREVHNLCNRAEKSGKRPALRLNGMTDIPWHTLPFFDGSAWYDNVYKAFPNVQFYEYTKSYATWQAARDIPNLSVTFSLSEDNDRTAAKVLAQGGNVAAVIRGGYAATNGEWSGYRAIDGDAYDLRFLDPANVVVALRVKGRANARHDGGGFFREPDGTLAIDRAPTFFVTPNVQGIGPVRSLLMQMRQAATARAAD